MRSLHSGRIRNSMIITYVVSITLMLALMGISFYFLTKKHLENEMGRRLVALASLTANEIPTLLLLQLQPGSETSRSFEMLRARLTKTISTGQVRRVYIADLQDQSLIDTDTTIRIGTPYFEHQLYRAEVARARTGIAADSPLFKGKDGLYYKNGFAPIFDARHQVIAVLSVQASADFFAEMQKMKRTLFYSISFIAILITLISIILAQRIVTPILRLVDAAKRIGAGDLATVVHLPYKNEFGALAQSINEMRQELHEKDGHMKAMLQGIAHEIRNPLGGIELFAGLLAEELPADNRSQQNSVQKIRDEVENLKLTVEQFLDFARDTSLQPERFNAKEFLDDVALAIRLRTDELGIALSVEVDDPKLQIWGDRRLLKSALLNIAQNALQAIEARKITTAKGTIRFAASKDGKDEAVAIVVGDNGVGIASSNLANLFRPFFTTKEKGCGLGLAFCNKIIHSHGGEIRVDSIQEGAENGAVCGTTVTMRIPI